MPIYKIGKNKKDGLQQYNVRINYHDNLGRAKQLTRTTYGLDAAKKLERELQFEIQNNNSPQAKRLTLQELFDEYVSVKKYEVRESSLDKSMRILKCHVLPSLSDVRLDKLSIRTMQTWKISIEQLGLSLTSKQNIFGEFRAMINYAVKMEYISKNPLITVGNFRSTVIVKKSTDFYTPEEFRKFIDVAHKNALQQQDKNGSYYEWNYYVFFNIAFYTGLRKGEIHALRWSDIDGDYLSVNRSIAQKLKGEDRETAPKNNSSIRTLQMPLPLIKILNDHKARQKQLPNFTGDSRILGEERSIRDSTIQKRNVLYSSSAGIKLIRIHDFRHSHASLLANMGINIQEVARRLGHAKIEMTWNTYSHLYPREEERAMSVLNMV